MKIELKEDAEFRPIKCIMIIESQDELKVMKALSKIVNDESQYIRVAEEIGIEPYSLRDCLTPLNISFNETIRGFACPVSQPVRALVCTCDAIADTDHLDTCALYNTSECTCNAPTHCEHLRSCPLYKPVVYRNEFECICGSKDSPCAHTTACMDHNRGYKIPPPYECICGGIQSRSAAHSSRCRERNKY